MGDTSWPQLPYPAWRDTAATLQLWTQIVGKIRLSLSPWLNHGWQVPLYVTARGLGTSPIPVGHDILEIEFDFLSHLLRMRMSNGEERELPLQPQSVADFYARIRAILEDLRIEVAINEMPNEVADPIRFSEDRVHASYDREAAHRFWRALVQADRVFKLFRSGFLGKSSPVHFFWGSFDLAVTRFSGRSAPLHPGGVPGLPDPVTREAYSHEVSSAGFWPGSDAFPQPAFYSYAYPEPPGFREAAVPAGASFDTTLGEFILPYDTVRQSTDPDALLLDFLVATYKAAADAGHWDRAALECTVGAPAQVRAV
ncbi:DUF5996 family protein [Microvirga terrae]|uniref:DUF5996 family protein n=1 Tax=Microvirga terrae TaxID=2740529 RepID=A0ABY5RN66_9HYPH|nr:MULTISPECIES: DUF5996 family protein [Microvirga]MBQ0823696.1 hypothetical protein [Microvirga sp. HBU67558]UVF18686.1 DUF5996 family protein [Microvirga terrae]